MNIQSNPCRVASQTVIRVPVPSVAKLPRLWFDLPAETQKQITQSVARLLLRMRSTGVPIAADRHVESAE